MRLLAAELIRLELELARTVASGAGEHRRRPVVLVRLETDVGRGWGECAALAAPSYTEEHADGAEQVLADHLLPLLLRRAGPGEGVEAALGRLAAVRGHPMAKAAIEMALLDAELRAGGRSLGVHLGATRTAVPAGATVGIGPPAAVLAEVAEAVEAGIRHVKCKIAPGADLSIVGPVREAYPGLDLSVDANGAYRLDRREDLDGLRALDALGLSAMEQPLAADDLVGHRELCRLLDTPVLLDESVPSLGLLEASIALGACDGVSLKPARLGGLLVARAAERRCASAGLHAGVGGMFETGLGRAASLAVAALPGVDLVGDLGPSERYFSPDLTEPVRLVGGELAVPSSPGIGAEPLEEVLEAATVRSRTIRA